MGGGEGARQIVPEGRRRGRRDPGRGGQVWAVVVFVILLPFSSPLQPLDAYATYPVPEEEGAVQRNGGVVSEGGPYEAGSVVGYVVRRCRSRSRRRRQRQRARRHGIRPRGYRRCGEGGSGG